MAALREARGGGRGPLDPTAALLFGAVALRRAGRPANPEHLRRLAAALDLPPPDALLLDALCELCSGWPPAAGAGAEGAGHPVPGARPAPAAAPDGVPSAGAGTGDALYVYGFLPAGRAPCTDGWQGLEGAPIRVVRGEELAALVHPCPPRPYVSEDPEVVHRWVQAHNQVLVRAAEEAGDVLPAAFNTIVGREGGDPAALLQGWLRQQGPSLRAALARVAGAREYGVQVVWELDTVREREARSHPELVRLSEAAKGEAAPGKQYLLRQELEAALRARLDALQRERKEAYRRFLTARVRELRDDPVRPAGEGKWMIASFSCLLSPAEEQSLASALADFASEGESVRLAGPWPPYSFANGPATAAAPAGQGEAPS